MRASQLASIITPAIEALGFELVTCKLHIERRQTILQIYIDSPQGITIGDCTQASRQINAMLEVEVPNFQGYQLEVSSPGLDRPLLTLAHYQRFIGRSIKITLHTPLSGRKNFTGQLLEIINDQVKIQVDNETFMLPLADIEKANLIPELRF